MMLPAPYPPAAISLGFGATRDPYSAENPHKGVDYSNRALGVVAGASILASGPGVVRRNGWEPGEQSPTQDRPNKWAGNSIDVDYSIAGQRVTARYMHRPSMIVGPTVDTPVTLGTYLGVIGDTGFVIGAHLHFEVWVNGARVSPSRYFDLTSSVGAAILAGQDVKPFEPPAPIFWEEEMRTLASETQGEKRWAVVFSDGTSLPLIGDGRDEAIGAHARLGASERGLDPDNEDDRKKVVVQLTGGQFAALGLNVAQEKQIHVEVDAVGSPIDADAIATKTADVIDGRARARLGS